MNHGANCTCFQGLSLHGAEDRILTVFQKLDMIDYAEIFISEVWNLVFISYIKLCKKTNLKMPKLLSETANRRT